MNTVGWYENALFGKSANNFLEPFSWYKTFINDRSSLLSADYATILFFVYAKIM